MKKIVLISIAVLFIMFVSINEAVEVNESQDENDNMIQLSKIIVSTIEKYDHTEKGVIPYEKYHLFLHQIFIKGHQLNQNTNPNSEVPQRISDLLKSATQDFKIFRYEQIPIDESKDQKQNAENENKQPEKRQFVELQQFYMDLIKHFSEFLDLEQNKEKYQAVNEFFFVQNSDETKFSTEEKVQNEGDKLQL